MALTTAGAQLIAKALTNLNAPTLFTIAGNSAYLGVGDSATAFAIGQVDAQAATNKSRVLATSVAESSGVLTIVGTWGTSVGNYEWVEVTFHNAPSGGAMLFRSVQSPTLGVKTSSQVWSLTITCTVAAA
jgi:hypothetical protein